MLDNKCMKIYKNPNDKRIGTKRKTPAWNKGKVGLQVSTRKGKSFPEKSGPNSPAWKGGLPVCFCGKKLSAYDSKRCVKCHIREVSEMKGESHFNYKKDRSMIKISDRHIDANYKIWMLAVKKRDGWKCKIANKDCEGRMEAHHILTWKNNPELRYEVKNGITLCHFHHPRTREAESRLSPFYQSLISVA